LRGRARLLGGGEDRHARTVIAKRHPVFQGLVVPLTHRICRYTTMHYEVSIANT